MNILLAIDDSELSRRAVLDLIAHARSMAPGFHIHLLYVAPPIPIPQAARKAGKQAVDAHYREEGHQALQWASKSLTEAGIEFTPHIHVGEAAFVILREADALGCTLIAMGTHGRSAIGRAALGSVAVRVLRASHLPVLFPRSSS